MGPEIRFNSYLKAKGTREHNAPLHDRLQDTECNKISIIFDRSLGNVVKHFSVEIIYRQSQLIFLHTNIGLDVWSTVPLPSTVLRNIIPGNS